MRPREHGRFLPGRDPKVQLDSGEQLKVEGPCQWFDDGERVAFWVAEDFTGPVLRRLAHSVELAN